MAGFPKQRAGVFYLTEGGQETEIMYKHGHNLPEFAMFPLLDNPAAVADLRAMYQRYLETAARHHFIALMGGLDYRASPDWGIKLGYSAEELAEAQLRSIAFLREVAKPFEGQLPGVMVVGLVGPRGDAYSLNRNITEAEAEEYHSVQLATLQRAGVNLASAMTFNNVAEAVGVVRAAARVKLPISVHLTLDGSGRLKSGPTVRQAIERIDAEAGDSRPDFYGINCSHPVEMEPAFEKGEWIKRVRCFRPNAALMEKQALCKIGHLVDGNPTELGRQMGMLSKRYPHVDIWGGCCGTWDRHLDEIAVNVREAHTELSSL
ncbi:homocysteine S-methyltransferase family protein [Aestuariivirga sp.]|uniref:homocysteine S-methyltransferase family protein n=1 Tax=Aestuariivirga sp. TaxID=2650926 RepID=UPI0039198802